MVEVPSIVVSLALHIKISVKGVLHNDFPIGWVCIFVDKFYHLMAAKWICIIKMICKKVPTDNMNIIMVAVKILFTCHELVINKGITCL